MAIAQVDSATVNVEQSQENVNIAQIAVDSQTAVVQIDQTILTEKQSELTDIQSSGNPTITYTSPGYVAPVSESSTITTTTLAPMWDAAAQIQTPFDIKMGDTLFNGQGTSSQIYVSSKAIISFGGADYTYWGWPNATQDGIYVFQSDYMSAGDGASIVVKTTDTTLSIEWILHRFGENNGPLTYINWDMTVDPTTGLWTGTGTMSGNTEVYGGPRTGIRQDNILTELTPVTTGYDQEAVALKQSEVKNAQDALAIAQSTLVLLQNDLTTSEEDLAKAKLDLETAKSNLEAALVSVTVAISEMNIDVERAENLVSTTFEAQEAEKARLAEIARQAAIEAENARIAAQQAYEAEQARIKAETEAKAAAEAAAKAEAERIAAEEAAKKAEADRIAAEIAAKEAADKAAAKKAALELKAAQEAEAKAKAEAEAKAKAESAAKAEAEKKAVEEAKAKAEADRAKEKLEAIKVEQDRLDKLAAEAKAGKELSTEEKAVVVEALVANLKPGESISAAEVKASGVSYADLPPSTPVEVRVSESGEPLVITAEVAAQVELVSDPGALLEAALTDPGAALAALGSIGADMTPEERKEATNMVVATVVATGAALNAVGLATGGSAPSAPSSGGSSSGTNSAGTRRNGRW